MGTKTLRPTSPGRRNATVADYAEITDRAKRPEKSLTRRIVRSGGRNFQGKITCRHTGGGARKIYRIVDFTRDRDGSDCRIVSVEYDPNRTCRIALVEGAGARRSYIIAPHGLKAGDVVSSGMLVEPKLGNCMPLSKIPVGTLVHNIELQPGKGGQLCRSAGCSATVNAIDSSWVQVTLPSGEVRRVPSGCYATIGGVGFSEWSSISLGKAGRVRQKGVRPYVRGSAMNPIAHPMGGGEGRRSGGRHPVSPTGKLAKGGRTRNPRRPTSSAIVRRRMTVRYGQVKI